MRRLRLDLMERARRRVGSMGPFGRVWLAVSLVAMMLLGVIGGMSFIALLNNATRHLDRTLIAVLEKQLRRPVRIASVDVMRPGRIRVTGLEVAAGRSFAGGLLLSAPEMIAQYRLWDLVRGRVDPVGSISRVDIQRPYLLIERYRNNRLNLQEFFPKRKRPPRPSPFRGLVRVHGGTVRFVDYAVRDLTAPQTNVLRALDGAFDAGGPPLMVFTASGWGDPRRSGMIRGEGIIQPDTGGFSCRIRTETQAAAYWSRYFAGIREFSIDSGSGVATVDVWKPRQGEPVTATIRVEARDGVARSRYTRAPITNVRGVVTLRTGRPMEIVTDLAGTTAGVPVRVTGSVFTGRDARVALKASASGVTMSSLRRIMAGVPEVPWMTPLAPATVDASVYGPMKHIVVVADAQLSRAKLYNTTISGVSARARYQDGVVYIPSITGMASGQLVSAEGAVNLRTRAIRLVANVPTVRAQALGLTELPLTGAITSRIVVTGTTAAPRTAALVTVRDGSFRNIPFDRLTARLTVGGNTVYVEDAVAVVPGGTLLARGTIRTDGPLDLRVNASGVRLGQLLPAAGYRDISGTAFFEGRVLGTTRQPVVQGQAQIYNIRARGQRIDYAAGGIRVTSSAMTLENVTVARYPAQGILSGTARFRPDGQVSLDMMASLQSGRIEPILRDAGLQPVVEGDVVTEAPVRIGGTLASPDIRGRIALTDANIKGYPVRMARAGFRFREGRLSLSGVEAESSPYSAGVTGANDGVARLSLPSLLIGKDSISAPQPFTVTNIQLARFRELGAPYVDVAGVVNITGHVSGTRNSPAVRATISADTLTVNAETFTDFSFDVAYTPQSIALRDLTAKRQGRELLYIPKVDWDQRSRTVVADVRTQDFPLQMLRDMMERSDWYILPAGEPGRRLVNDLKQLDVHLDAATLTAANALEEAGSAGTLRVTYAMAGLSPEAPAGLSLEGAVRVANVRMQDQTLDQVSVTGAIRDLRNEGGRLAASFNVPEDMFTAETGNMIVRGNIVGAVGGNVQADLDAINMPLSIARLFVKRSQTEAERAAFDPAHLKGDLTVSVVASGEWDRPHIETTFNGRGIVLPGTSVPLSLTTSPIVFENRPDGTVISTGPTGSIVLRVRNQPLLIKGTLPFDWKTKLIPRDRQVSLQAHIGGEGVENLGLLLSGVDRGPVESAKGSLVADLSLSGTLRQQAWSGYVQVHDASVKLRALQTTFRNINADIDLKRTAVPNDPGRLQNALIVNRLQMESSDGGTLRVAEGSRVTAPTFGNLAGTFEPDISLALENFRVEEVPNALGFGERVEGTLSTPANAPLRIVRRGGNPLLSGEVALSDVAVVPPNTIPAATGGGQPPAIIPAFDLNLVAGKNVWVRNPLFRVHLNDRGAVSDRSLRVAGTLDRPRISGRLTSREGTLIYPTARFRLTDAVIRVHYPPVEDVTGATEALLMTEEAGFTIEANAQARLIATVNGRRQPITMYMHIEGPNPTLARASEASAFGSLAPYRITLRSSPSLPERQLVALITREDALQRLAQGGDPQQILGQETMNILQASVLPEALSGFESRLGEAFGLESLSLDYTMMNNTLSVTATKRVTNRIELTYSRPIGEAATENAYTISLNYEIRPRLRLTLQQERNPYSAGIRQTGVPGSDSTITETSLLLEGSFPF